MYVYANPKTKTCQVVESEDIVDAIANAPKDKTDTPLKAITLDVNIMKVKAKKLNQYGFKIPRSN